MYAHNIIHLMKYEDICLIYAILGCAQHHLSLPLKVPMPSSRRFRNPCCSAGVMKVNRFAADLFNSIRADLLRQQEAQPFSVGSAGHPYTCSNPCKYVWRKQGCRDGADCPNCHYCKWQRKPKEEANDVGTPVPQGEHLEAMLANIPPPPGLTPMEPTSEMKTQQRLGSKISYMPDSMILSAHFVHSKDKAQESGIKSRKYITFDSFV